MDMDTMDDGRWDQVRMVIAAGGLSLQGESVAKAFLWEKETLPNFQDEYTFEEFERLENDWAEHSSYASATAKALVRTKLDGPDGWRATFCNAADRVRPELSSARSQMEGTPHSPYEAHCTSTRRDRFLQEVRDGVVGVTLHEPRDRARDMATVDLDEVDKD